MPNNQLGSDASTAMVVAALAQQATAPVEVTDGKLYAVLDAAGNVTIVPTPGYTDQHDDERSDRPRQVKRTVTLLDVDSFTDYLARNTYLTDDKPHVGLDCLHGDGSIELWADIDNRRILAILDGIGFRLGAYLAKMDPRPGVREFAERLTEATYAGVSGVADGQGFYLYDDVGEATGPDPFWRTRAQ